MLGKRTDSSDFEPESKKEESSSEEGDSKSKAPAATTPAKKAKSDELLEPYALSDTVQDRKFYFNGRLAGIDKESYFYVPTLAWSEKNLLPLVKKRNMGVLYGPSQSGKTTRIWELMPLLKEEGYLPIYIPSPPTTSDVDEWWKKFGQALSPSFPELGKPVCDSDVTFHVWWLTLQKPVLFLDEADVLKKEPAVMESFLATVKSIRDAAPQDKIQSIWLVGRFLATKVRTRELSPFNMSQALSAPHFSETEVEDLFLQFASQQHRSNLKNSPGCPAFKLPRAIVKDVYQRTSGHPGLANLCGVMLERLVEANKGRAPTLEEWSVQLAAQPLWREYSISNNGIRIVETLANRNHLALAVKLLGSKEMVIAKDDVEFAYQLAQHGIVTFTKSSPLVAKLLCPAVASLVRREFAQRRAPLKCLLEWNASDIPALLKHVLPYFDRELLLNPMTWQAKSYTRGGRPLPVEALFSHTLHHLLQLAFEGTDFQLMTGVPLVGKTPDLVIACASSNSLTPTSVPVSILELCVNNQLSTTAEKPSTHTLREHFDKAADYALQLRVPAWVVHFTNGDITKPLDTPKAGTNVHALHIKFNEAFTTAKFLNASGDVLVETFSLAPALPTFDLVIFLRDEAKIDAEGVKAYVPLLHKNKVDEAKLHLLTDTMLLKWGIEADLDRAAILDAVQKRTAGRR